MYDTALIQRLRQKLSYGNRRSIHLNALPGNLLTRLDAIGLDQLQAGLSDSFLAQLLDQTAFELTLSFKPSTGKSLHELNPDEQKALQHTARRLDGLVYDNRDHYLTYGTETFGFGFPLLLRRDTQQPDKIIKAPVFIWQLGIEKIDSQTLAWRVRRSDDRAVYINPILLSHLESDTGLNLSALRTEYAEDGYLSRQEITDFCNRLLAQINANHEYVLPALVPCPNNDTLKHIGIGKPLIRWSGVFGLYRMPKQAIIDDLDRLLQNPAHSAVDTINTPHLSPQKSSLDLPKTRHARPKNTDYVVKESTFEPPIRFAAVSADPAQQAIVNRLGQTQYQIIQGPPGTGKSQSLTALLTRALADGKRCLVVCEKRAALEVLQRNLQRIGLADLSILIEDTDRDRQRVVNAVRQSMEVKTTLPPYAPATLAQQEQIAETTARQLLRQHQFLAQKRWHHYNWTNLVGKYCHANERQSKQCLDAHLFALGLRHFQFDAPTFDRLRQTVQQAQPLYATVGTLQHPLTAIDRHWFATRQSGDLYQYLEHSLPRFIGSAQGLIEAGESLLLRYTQLLDDHYAQYAQGVGLKIEQLLQSMAQGRAQYGEVFDQWRGLSKIWVNLCATLSPHHRQLRQDREQIVARYQTFSQFIAQHTHGTLLQSRTYIDHTAIATQPKDPPFALSDIAQELARCQTNLANMAAQTRDWVNLYTKNLNEGFILPHLHDVMSNPTATWQTQTQQFLCNLQAEKLLQSPTAWEYNSDITQQQAIAEQLRVLRLIAAQLQTIYAALPQFRVFYQWQHFWTTQPNDAQQLLIALARSSASDWTAAYESWYLNNWLIRLETDAVPQSDATIRTLSAAIRQVATQLPNAIQHYWQNEQRSRTTDFDQRQTNQFNAKRLYNQRSTQERRRSTLRQIVHADFDLFSAYFPICLVNPVVCSALFPLQRALFDVVIFDEAGQLRIEDTYCALWRGHTQIVSGDMHQMPPSDYFQSHQAQLLDTNADADPDTLYTEDSDLADRESLLAYAEDRNFEQSYLDFHYRSQHPYLIDFSNAAFYQSRLVPMPALSPYTPIYFEAVNGVYGNQTNPAEADAIVRYLSTQIPAATQSEQLPSVGIATLNLYQRNLILDNLQRLKAQGGTAAAHIIALEARGLFVKNLENIQGDERDIMLVSTTFGLRDDGKFTQHFGAINTQKGYRLLNVLVTRAKQRMCVFTSIPPAYYQGYAEELQKSTPSGRVYLYAYLCYAQAVAEGKEDARLQLLQQLSQHAPISDKPTQGRDLADSTKTPINMAVGDDLLNYIADALRRQLPANYRVQTQYTQGGISIPIAIWHDKPNTPPTLIAAVECDHAPQHHSPEAYMYDLSRQRCFAQMGAATLRTYAADWWLNPDTTCQNLCAQLRKHGK